MDSAISNIRTEVDALDKTFGGEPISDENLEMFEKAYWEVMHNTPEGEMQERIKEISDLLTVTEHNFDFIKEQKWFQRAWYTVTRKNSKLETINKHNLIMIQKAAVFFLNRMALENQTIMHTVQYCLERIQHNQIQDEKIKVFIIEWTKRTKTRMEFHDERIARCERDIERLAKESASSANWWTQLKKFIRRLFLKINGRRDESPGSTIIEVSKMKEKNRRIVDLNTKLKPIIYSNIVELVDVFVLQNCDCYLSPFANYRIKCNEIFESIPQGKVKSEIITKAIYDCINVQEMTTDKVDRAIMQTVNGLVESLNRFADSIFTYYLPQSPYRLQTEVSHEQRRRMIDNITNINNTIKAELTEREKSRVVLNGQWPKYNKYVTKAPYVEIGANMAAGFAAGFLLGPIGLAAALGYSLFGEDLAQFFGIETKPAYVKSFITSYEKYMEWGDKIVDEVYPDVYNAIAQSLRMDTKSFVNQLYNVLDEFDEYYISLETFSTDLIELLNSIETQSYDNQTPNMATACAE